MKIEGGFTLVELVVVIGLITLVALMATLNFSRWTAKSTVEGYTKEIYSLLMKARNDATNTNELRLVDLTANRLEIGTDPDENMLIESSDHLAAKDFARYAIAADVSPFTFNRRGLTQNNLIRITGYPANTNPAMDCIAISATRLNIGLMTGGNCVQR